jgi:hypothetical protein
MPSKAVFKTSLSPSVFGYICSNPYASIFKYIKKRSQKEFSKGIDSQKYA